MAFPFVVQTGGGKASWEEEILISLHSTTTHLSILIQFILDNFNQKQLSTKTVLTAIDLSRAFSTVPRGTLTDKIMDIYLHTNYKMWLANFFAGRQEQVSYIDSKLN